MVPRKENYSKLVRLTLLVLALTLTTSSAFAGTLLFSTGDPDGRIATRSRPSTDSSIQTETADDFILNTAVTLDQATFTGLLPSRFAVSDISQVEIEFYHVFPGDSKVPPSNNVPTRMNSPGDVEIASATRDSLDGSLSFTASVLNPNFTASNSVVNGISVNAHGEGAVTGEEVLFTVNFNSGIFLAADHYFFRPEVLLPSGDFLWLSAARPIVAPGTPISPDLQTWIRNDTLAPDWLRVGGDVVGGTTFNAAFSLSGADAPEPGTATLLVLGTILTAWGVRRRRAK